MGSRQLQLKDVDPEFLDEFDEDDLLNDEFPVDGYESLDDDSLEDQSWQNELPDVPGSAAKNNLPQDILDFDFVNEDDTMDSDWA